MTKGGFIPNFRPIKLMAFCHNGRFFSQKAL